jgi:hypothetical protein
MTSSAREGGKADPKDGTPGASDGAAGTACAACNFSQLERLLELSPPVHTILGQLRVKLF